MQSQLILKMSSSSPNAGTHSRRRLRHWSMASSITFSDVLLQSGPDLNQLLSQLVHVLHFLPRDALQCKARYCHRMSSVCLSVCLSVTLVNCDHIGWNSSKIISLLVSLGRSLFATPTWRVCSKGNTRNFRPNGGGVLRKRLSAYKSSSISETRQDRTKVTIEVEQEVI